MSNHDPRICAAPDCEEEFRPRQENHRYCSAACRKRGWRSSKMDEVDELLEALRDEIRRLVHEA